MKWKDFPNWDFHAAAGSREPYAKLPASPWGNELIEQFAEQAVAGEKLGQRGPDGTAHGFFFLERLCRAPRWAGLPGSARYGDARTNCWENFFIESTKRSG